MEAARLRFWCIALLAFLLSACAADSARNSADQERKLDERARSHAELGLGYYEAGKQRFAIEELNEALKARPKYVPALVGLALVHMDLHEDAKAETYFQQAQRADPANAMTQNNYGQFLCARGRTEEGLRLLLAAANNPLYETPDAALKNAGLCARRAGDPVRAEEFFRQAVSRNPRQLQSLYNLADIYLAKGDARQAKVFMDRALQGVESPGPELLWLAARIERRLGEKTLADRHAEQLRRRFPDAPETRALLEGRYE